MNIKMKTVLQAIKFSNKNKMRQQFRKIKPNKMKYLINNIKISIIIRKVMLHKFNWKI